MGFPRRSWQKNAKNVASAPEPILVGVDEPRQVAAAELLLAFHDKLHVDR
jgi:hypothetical protein